MKINSIGKIVLFLLFIVSPFVSSGQDCSSFIKYHKADYPYEYNGQSKSATCVSGNTYKFLVTLSKSKKYKISFYASSIFNNRMDFKIIDKSSNDVLMERPGESDKNNKEGSVLVAPSYMDREGKYPHFEFIPKSTMKLQIEISVKKSEHQKTGCVGVLIQDKPKEGKGF